MLMPEPLQGSVGTPAACAMIVDPTCTNNISNELLLALCSGGQHLLQPKFALVSCCHHKCSTC